MAKVLVTGSAGAVGIPVCDALIRRGHHVRGFDLRPSPTCTEFAEADLTQPSAVSAAMQDMDAVVHLAAQAHDVPFDELIEPNVIGLFRVLSAAQDEGVRRVVLASSIQVVGRRADGAGPVPTTEASPGNHYALTKVWAEQMGEMYARRFGMSVIAARIAWMVRNVEEADKMQSWNRPELYLSRNDVGRFMVACVEAEHVGFQIVYAASKGGENQWDMEPSRRLLGYVAEDTFPEGLGFEFPPPQ